MFLFLKALNFSLKELKKENYKTKYMSDHYFVLNVLNYRLPYLLLDKHDIDCNV